LSISAATQWLSFFRDNEEERFMNYKVLFVLLIGVGLSLVAPPAAARLGCHLGPKIDFRDPLYSLLPNVQTQNNVGAYDEESLRTGLMTRLTAAYRLNHGSNALPVGSTFKMVYKDGTRECGRIETHFGTPQARPVENSQRPYAGPGEVEETSSYMNLFNRNRPQVGFYTVCWDYYTNGVRTDSECEYHRL
jgi:hypothetical protein